MRPPLEKASLTTDTALSHHPAHLKCLRVVRFYTPKGFDVNAITGDMLVMAESN